MFFYRFISKYALLVPTVLFFGCLFFFTNQAGAQIVINEVLVRPTTSTATPPNGLIYTNSEEYIELYNSSCDTINVQ
jgi:hypothetical protein